MNLDELRSLVERGESETVEFKRTTGQRREAAKSLCAMLNGSVAGQVIIGVGDDGHVVGQVVSATTMEDMAQQLRMIEPFPSVVVDVVPVDDALSVIVMGVTGGGGFYTYDGRPYHRVGPTTSIMPRAVSDRMVLQQWQMTERWEIQPVPDSVTIDDLDGDEIRRSVDRAIESGRLAPLRDRSIEYALRGLRLIENDILMNAAVVLFVGVRDLQNRYPQLSVRSARFAGTSRVVDFIDNRQVWGNAFQLFDAGEAFLRAHTPIAGRVVEGRPVREDRPLYASRVLREAMANAICHRDYRDVGGALSIAMFDDRVEIGNPGALPAGLTPAQLALPHQSKPHNPTIAQVLYRTGIVEQFATGTLSMIEWSRLAGARDPEWVDDSGGVTVTLFPVIDGRFQREPESRPESQPESQPESSTLLLADRILFWLGDAPRSKRELSELLGQQQISGQLNAETRRLLKQGMIEPTIPEKPQSRLQKYRITEVGRTRLQIALESANR